MSSFDLGDRASSLTLAKPHISEPLSDLLQNPHRACITAVVLRPAFSFRRFHGPLSLAKVPPSIDVLTPERLLGSKLIVGPAAHPEIVRTIRSTESSRFGMVELEECARTAAAAA
jgi:hypothetical protein